MIWAELRYHCSNVEGGSPLRGGKSLAPQVSTPGDSCASGRILIFTGVSCWLENSLPLNLSSCLTGRSLLHALFPQCWPWADRTTWARIYSLQNFLPDKSCLFILHLVSGTLVSRTPFSPTPSPSVLNLQQSSYLCQPPKHWAYRWEPLPLPSEYRSPGDSKNWRTQLFSHISFKTWGQDKITEEGTEIFKIQGIRARTRGVIQSWGWSCTHDISSILFSKQDLHSDNTSDFPTWMSYNLDDILKATSGCWERENQCFQGWTS